MSTIFLPPLNISTTVDYRDDPQPPVMEDSESKPRQVVVEADEIVFKAGEATITLKKADGGIVEIHAPNLRLSGEEILSEATGSNTTVGRKVVSESLSVTELLGKLVRIDGQFVKIS